jgi:hypothetical protein
MIRFSPTNAKLFQSSQGKKNHIAQPFRPDKSVHDRYTGIENSRRKDLIEHIDASRGSFDCCTFAVSRSFRDVLVESGGVTTPKVLASLAFCASSAS